MSGTSRSRAGTPSFGDIGEATFINMHNYRILLDIYMELNLDIKV